MAGIGEKLFQPIQIGPMMVKNRIVSTGHDTTLSTDDRVNEALVAYHTARAEGGVGLIVSQVTGVHETARYTSHVLMATDDTCIPGFRKLAEAVHANDARLVVQLFHPGREIMETDDGTLPVAYAPSAVPSERFHTVPRALPYGIIGEIIEGYAAAAERMQKAGVDGVEIVASHGYLPAQFLNSVVNLRTDEYGGDLSGRSLFLKRVLEAVRAAVGPNFALGMRITGEEQDETGLEAGEVLDVIRTLVPNLDYVSIAAGTSATLGGAVHIAPPMFFESGYTASFASLVKQAVDIPVIVTGRINQPQDAEALLASDQADMCGMTRALICDPGMPGKAKARAYDDIRACIGCNQACIGHFHKGVPISCIQHPETGRELTYATLVPAKNPRRVVVVGGGPAGMKASAVAAARGHDVTLLEAGAQLGGQVLLAQLLPGRSEFGGLLTNLSREMILAGVETRLNTPADVKMLAEIGANAIIVATGAGPRQPVAEISEDTHVANAWQVLKGEVNVGDSVVIADWRGDWTGLGLAEQLAAAGRRIRLAVNGLYPGESLQHYVRDTMVSRASRLGVEFIPYARLFGADGNIAYFIHSASGESLILEDMDTLVLAQGQASEITLLDQLSSGSDVHVIGIGDCLAPRTAEEAVLEGLKCAWSL